MLESNRSASWGFAETEWCPPASFFSFMTTMTHRRHPLASYACWPGGPVLAHRRLRRSQASNSVSGKTKAINSEDEVLHVL